MIPFALTPPEDRAAIANAVGASSSILNVGGQLANGLMPMQGLVRLAPETLSAIQAGAKPLVSGGYNIGTLAQGGKISAQIRWLPVSGVTAVGLVAAIGPALAMVAMQAQLSEISGMARENLQLTETVLNTVRREQWTKLSGMAIAMSGAIEEANAVGQVTQLLWENVSRSESELRAHRELFLGNVSEHSSALSSRGTPRERRQYIQRSGEAIVLDVQCLVVAHKAWFEYQALRAARARASSDLQDRRLAETIGDNATLEYQRVVGELAAVLTPLTRELSLLAELPGRPAISLPGARKDSDFVARAARQLLATVERVSNLVRPPAPLLERPEVCAVEEPDRVDQDLRILRWHLDEGESLLALATAREPGALDAFPGARDQLLVAATDERVLIADLADFRREGLVERGVPIGDIRYVRLRDGDPSGRAEIDVITKDDNLTWRFGKGSASNPSVRELAALLADRMDIPAAERIALRELPAAESAAKQLAG